MGDPVRVTENGRVSIPDALRERYDLRPGDEVVWLDTDDGLVVRKRTRTAARGMLLPDDVSDETRRAVAEELSRRLRARRGHDDA